MAVVGAFMVRELAASEWLDLLSWNNISSSGGAHSTICMSLGSYVNAPTAMKFGQDRRMKRKDCIIASSAACVPSVIVVAAPDSRAATGHSNQTQGCEVRGLCRRRAEAAEPSLALQHEDVRPALPCVLCRRRHAREPRSRRRQLQPPLCLQFEQPPPVLLASAGMMGGAVGGGRRRKVQEIPPSSLHDLDIIDRSLLKDL
uniref:Uncharacterized protein n=1 Tax=Oryza meridionalis TaxID=40149 RepID=A0A0E0DNC9_9ORYZ